MLPLPIDDYWTDYASMSCTAGLLTLGAMLTPGEHACASTSMAPDILRSQSTTSRDAANRADGASR